MKTKILFIGGTLRGLELIKMLTEGEYEIVYAYILKEDDHEPIKVSDAIAKICRDNRIPGKITKKIELKDIPNILAMEPDVGFVCGWRTLISGHLYNGIPFGCLAAHDSLLPKYRGCAPTVWAIINGEKETGVTLFKIADGGVDSGDVFGQKTIPIGEDETITQVYPRIVTSTLELYKEFLNAYEKRSVFSEKQDHSKVTYAARRTPEHGRIDWNKSSRDVYNLVRALQPPYPYAWTTYDGKKLYIKKLLPYEGMLSFTGSYSGRVVSIQEEGVVIACGRGEVLLQQLVSEDGKNVNANQVITSSNAVLGDTADSKAL